MIIISRASRSQSTPAAPKPRFSFGTTNTSATGPKKVSTLGCDKPRTTFIPAQDDNGDGGGDDNGDGFGNGDGGFDDDSNDGDDIQVPMNRVVVGTAPSPNLTVSQAR